MLRLATFALTLATTLLPAQEPAQQPTPKPSPNLAGIAHVALRVHDLPTSIAFYEKLGFVKAFELARDGKVYEAFIKINDRQFIELYPADEKNPQIGFLHLCFEGTDLPSVHDFYVAQGLTPNAVRTAGAGNLLFTMPGPATPQGPQNLEYTQYMPGSLHSKDFGQHLGKIPNGARLISVQIASIDPAAAKTLYLEKLGFHETDTKGPNATLSIPGSPDESIQITTPNLGFRAAFTLSENPPPDEVAKASGVVVSSGTDLINDPDGNMIHFRHYHVLK